MPLYVCSSLAFTHLDVTQAFEQVAAAGFLQVELAIRGDNVWPGHVDVDALRQKPLETLNRLKRAIEHSGVRVASAGFHVSEKHSLTEELECFRVSCRLVSSAGGSAMSIFLMPPPDATVQERYQAFKTVANDNDLTLFVETHRNTLTENPQECLRWAEKLGMQLNLDYDHYRSQGLAFEDYKILLPYSGMMQIREPDPPRLEEHCLPILDHGFGGQITLEYLQMPGESLDLKPRIEAIFDIISTTNPL